MAGKCILRVTKLKSAGGVSGYAAHNTRERPTPNADTARKELNSVLVGGSQDQVMSLWRNRVALDKAPRKNAVVALDYLVHASPGSLTASEREAYLKDALAWIAKVHGRENIVQAAIHRDEGTEAHLHVIVVPLAVHHGKRLDGALKLNAGHWLDGRKKLSAMQTAFAKEVGRPHGLERGIEGSVAKHEDVKRFYGLLKAPLRSIRVEVSRPPKLGAIMDLDAWKAAEEARIAKTLSPIYQRVQAQERKTEQTASQIKNLTYTAECASKDRDRWRAEANRANKALLTMPVEEILARREAAKQASIEIQRDRKDRGIDR